MFSKKNVGIKSQSIGEKNTTISDNSKGQRISKEKCELTEKHRAEDVEKLKEIVKQFINSAFNTN